MFRKLFRWLFRNYSKRRGYVYVLSNPAMPGLYKVGMTTRAPEERKKELFQTGVPTEFKIEFCISSRDPWTLEKQAHDKLKKFRYNSRREFFQCDLRHITKTLRQL